MGKTSDAAYKVQPQSPLQAGTWTDAFQQGLLFEFYVNALLFHIVSWHHWCVCLQIFLSLACCGAARDAQHPLVGSGLCFEVRLSCLV